MAQQMFGRRNEDGKIAILHETGEVVTRLPGATLWQPDGLGAGYEHPAGLVADTEESARRAVETAGNVWTGLE